MITGFKTKSSTYYLNLQNKSIWGGVLGMQAHYFNSVSRIFIGEPAIIYFDDGCGNILLDKYGNPQGIRTGVVQSFLQI